MSKHIPFRLAPEIRKRVTITADGDLLSKGTPNKFLDDIKNFEVRPTDVFVITWPRSGTTWTQYIVSQIVHGQEFTDKHNINRINYYIEMQISTVDSPEACNLLPTPHPPPSLALFICNHMDYYSRYTSLICRQTTGRNIQNGREWS
ncbi:putative sulfotransferase 1C4-like [Apostichopus japonicus]|uniref:Putative sulfotransferase 1C4-like n=1 Tax=Stichopus japonicus TaxID=307972 RepID=A0A2G8LDD0_STIJA|nr:putative sulfotransferase 1C4-like [Apostichopus japonicus]